MKINWKVRIKNKVFWTTFIPAVILLIQAVAGLLGYTFDFTALKGNLLSIVESVFALLAVLGVVVDNTTAGISDSQQALTYDKPKK